MSGAAAPLSSPRLFLFGLEAPLVADLQRVLPEYSIAVDPELPEDSHGCAIRLLRAEADIVFCPAHYPKLSLLLETARGLSVPVVVVTRFPDTNEWLDAMDAGASDYTAPPFEQRQLMWILDTNLRLRDQGSAISVNSIVSTAPQALQTSAPSSST